MTARASEQSSNERNTSAPRKSSRQARRQRKDKQRKAARAQSRGARRHSTPAQQQPIAAATPQAAPAQQATATSTPAQHVPATSTPVQTLPEAVTSSPGAGVELVSPPVALPDEHLSLDFDDEFFREPALHGLDAAPTHSAPELIEADEVEVAPLPVEVIQRRLWFRRQVARLMTGMGAFSIVAAVARLAGS